MSKAADPLGSIPELLWRPSLVLALVALLVGACAQDATAPSDPGTDPDPGAEPPSPAT